MSVKSLVLAIVATSIFASTAISAAAAELHFNDNGVFSDQVVDFSEPDKVYSNNFGIGSAAITLNPIPSVSAFIFDNAAGSYDGATLDYLFLVHGKPNTTMRVDFGGLFSFTHSTQTGRVDSSMDFSISNYSSKDFFDRELFIDNADRITYPLPVVPGRDEVPVYTRISSVYDQFYGTAATSTSLIAEITQGQQMYAPFYTDETRGYFSGWADFVLDGSGTGVGYIELSGSIAANDAGDAGFIIDPELHVDPSYLALDPTATLNVEPGVGNATPAVPEPATWSMLILGLAGVGAAIRARRGPAATVA